jgi:hypothetical protein
LAGADLWAAGVAEWVFRAGVGVVVVALGVG